MQAHYIWLILGFVLAIAEMATGTFYLLVLGITCFVAAGAALAGADFHAQVPIAVVVGVLGCLWVAMKRRLAEPKAMPSLDAGQPVRFESWVDKVAGMARVHYRDALWDAHVVDAGEAGPGDVLHIVKTRGNLLEVRRGKA